MSTVERGLHRIADDVWAWVVPNGTWGWSNAGLVAGDGASVLFDTLFDLELTRELLDALAPITAQRPITDVVNSHADGDHCYGNELLADSVRIHASSAALPGMRAMPPQAIAAMLDADLGPVLGPFVQECFGPFRLHEVTFREPNSPFDGDAVTLAVGGRELRLHKLGPAHSAADVIGYVPDAGVLFAADLLFIGSTPIMWAGPIDNWISACDTMLELAPTVVVPGHGPLTDVDGIREFRGYLSFVADYGRSSFAAGKGWRQAAAEIDLGDYAALPDADRVVVTLYNLYRELDDDLAETGIVELFGAMATWRADRAG